MTSNCLLATESFQEVEAMWKIGLTLRHFRIKMMKRRWPLNLIKLIGVCDWYEFCGYFLKEPRDERRRGRCKWFTRRKWTCRASFSRAARDQKRERERRGRIGTKREQNKIFKTDIGQRTKQCFGKLPMTGAYKRWTNYQQAEKSSLRVLQSPSVLILLSKYSTRLTFLSTSLKIQSDSFVPVKSYAHFFREWKTEKKRDNKLIKINAKDSEYKKI